MAETAGARRYNAHMESGLNPAAHPVSAILDAQDADVLSTREGYDRWAAIYDDEDNALIALEAARVDALVGDVRGREVVDVGCGTGRHALRLAAAGATVTGVDFSEGMLARARAKHGAEQVRWVVHDLTAPPLPLPDAGFDRVLCCLVVEHIRRLDVFMAELRRLCRPDGRVIVSAMHPAMMLRGITARFTDPQTGRDTRPRSHPNQIADFLTAAMRAGLRLDHISEYAVDEALAARSPRAAKYLGWPMLLLMRFLRE